MNAPSDLKFSFRTWRRSDATAIARLIVLCWEAYDPGKVRPGMHDFYTNWVEVNVTDYDNELMVVGCDEHNAVQAIAGLSRLKSRKRRRGLLHSVCVNPAMRGAGLGRQLVLATLQQAREEGYAELVMDGVKNPVALSLYRSTGFVETGHDESGGVTMAQQLIA